MNAMNTIRISPEEMKTHFTKILLSLDFSPKDAKMCADIFTQNSVDGVYSHGVNTPSTLFCRLHKKGTYFPKKQTFLKK